MYLDTKQAADHLGVSRQFLEKARHFGNGPVHYALTPRCIRYTREDLDAYAEAGRRTCTRGEPEAA